MNKLEHTIRIQAAQKLRELKVYIEAQEETVDIHGLYAGLLGLIELGHLQDSGLSDQGSLELVNIEREALKVMTTFRPKTTTELNRYCAYFQGPCSGKTAE